MQLRIHLISRDSREGDRPSGFIVESRLFEFPHWHGLAGPTHYETMVRYRWFSDKMATPSLPAISWLCYFKAIRPERKCISVDSEREDLKMYVDENSHLIEFTDSEAAAWFKRHGRQMPAIASEPTKKANSETVEAAAKYIRKNPGSKGIVIAKAISITAEHFRSRIVPKLRDEGFYNRNGYYAPPKKTKRI